MQVLGCSFKPFLTPSKSADRWTIQPNSLLTIHRSMYGGNNESSINNKEKGSMEKSMAKQLRNKMFLGVPS